LFDRSETGGSHAVVIGASIAGLLAAHVLANHFDRVTLVERDRLPDEPEFRKGVPQGRHIHVLLVGGNRRLEQFFPGLNDELAAAGAACLDWTADCWWFNFGGWKPHFASGLTSMFGSRPLLEYHIRRRVAAQPKLRWLPECDATALLADENRTRVTGVRLRPRTPAAGEPAEWDLPADLVVNASGRDSRAAEWLKSFGYPAPPETRINSFLGYATRAYERPAGWQADWQALIISATPPKSSRGAVIVPLEGGRWLVTLAGAARDYPPTDEAAFLDFARSLPTPVLYQTIKDARPLTDITAYRRTENLRRHYAHTLDAWAERFDLNWPKIQAIDPKRFDERFRRVWRVYLYGCAEMFRSPRGRTHLFQIVFAKGNVTHQTYPMSRRFLYEDEVVRLAAQGIRRPGDPLIEDSLRVVDATLMTEFPAGPCWRRYNHDGYGQRDNGGPFLGWGVGRPWPLLTATSEPRGTMSPCALRVFRLRI